MVRATKKVTRSHIKPRTRKSQVNIAPKVREVWVKKEALVIRITQKEIIPFP